jgi:CRISPR-associated endonuclease Csn1
MLSRVGSFKGDYRNHKLQRFQWTSERVAEILSDFTERQLNDTRYASKLAARYLACLYGGLSDSAGRQRIFVSPGQVTAFLRRLWAIEGMLSSGQGKSRDDHRHHFIDAVVIALTGPTWVKALADAADRARQVGRSRFASLEAPWQGFVDEVRHQLTSLVISHRVSRKVGGPMHDEMFYGVIQDPLKGPLTVKRKLVHELTSSEVEQVVDPRVRERVQLQLNVHQQKFEKLEQDPPTLPTRDGRVIPIRKVRIWISKKSRQLAEGFRARNVIGDQYDHFEIVRCKDLRTGGLRWNVSSVSIQEAMQRVRDKKPVVCRDHGPRADFVCSIAKDETLEIREGGRARLVVVRVLEATTGRVALQELNDARPYSQIDKKGLRRAIAPLMSSLECRKVAVSPLGEVRYAND